jgi:hypothetical protein
MISMGRRRKYGGRLGSHFTCISPGRHGLFLYYNLF